ncbi:hypothetical protein AB3M83_11310 [Microbacterium sp. 179-B 1A2 NHS]|uniref:hypothetical protein n=1 Tax=Microbacterium sp. 179-B 1A2 NHS TaxID=3142383 RepID=UPI0039A1F3B0
MRWDRFFEDLEDQLDSEEEAERAALDTEAERLRFARLTLTERMTAVSRDPAVEAVVDLVDGSVVTGPAVAVGPDWVAIDGGSRSRGAVLVPFAAIEAVGMPHADLLRSARGAAPGPLQERMTLGFVLRDLVRRRVPVTVRSTGGRDFSGTIDRAASDHLDIALHDCGVPRRSDLVTGHRLLPLLAVVSVRLESPVPLV